MISTYDSSNYSPWYALLIVGGTIIAVLIMLFQWKRRNLSTYHFWILVPILSVIAIYGARWWYLAFNPADFNGIQDIFIPFGGRSILGSIFFVTLSLFLYCKYFGGEQLEFRETISIILPNMLLAQAIGRWGNFFNQEVYGAAVEDLSWLPTYIQEGMYINGAYRQPLFLYESFADLLAWFIIIFVINNIKYIKRGVGGGAYIMFYGIIRSSMELYRDPTYIMNINGVPTSFILAIIFAVFGLGMIIYYQFIYENTKWYKQSTFYLATKKEV